VELTDSYLAFYLGPARLSSHPVIQELLSEKQLPFETLSEQAFRVNLPPKKRRNGIVFARNLLKDITYRVNNK
jgi:hypothetical protein